MSCILQHVKGSLLQRGCQRELRCRRIVYSKSTHSKQLRFRFKSMRTCKGRFKVPQNTVLKFVHIVYRLLLPVFLKPNLHLCLRILFHFVFILSKTMFLKVSTVMGPTTANLCRQLRLRTNAFLGS